MGYYINLQKLLFLFVILFLLLLNFGCQKKCAKEGERIGAVNMPELCCSGLQAEGGWPGEYGGDCSLPPPPSGLSICSDCGNQICEANNGENKCNCPADCK